MFCRRLTLVMAELETLVAANSDNKTARKWVTCPHTPSTNVSCFETKMLIIVVLGDNVLLMERLFDAAAFCVQ
jgi:hypothetical protein